MLSVDKNDKKTILITTPLKEFWQTGEEIVYLADWCFLEQEFVHHNEKIVIPSPWGDVNDLEKTFDYLMQLHERVLAELVLKLNLINKKQYSLRHWRIILSPWLYYYLTLTYEKYLYIKKSLTMYPEFSTVCLSENDYVTPLSDIEFYHLILGDKYNLQIISRIFGLLGFQFRTKSINIPNVAHSNSCRKPSIKAYAKKAARFCVNKLHAVFSTRSKVFLNTPYFNNTQQLLFLIASWGKVSCLPSRTHTLQPLKIDTEKRKLLNDLNLGESEFERLFGRMLSFDIPACFVEQFSDFESLAQAGYPKSVNVIFSAGGWYSDTLFKYWAGAMAEKGAILTGISHGGRVGEYCSYHVRNYEMKIMDYYYTWGWDCGSSVSNVIKMSSPILLGRKPIGQNFNEKAGILMGVMAVARYTHMFPYTIDFYKNYMAWHKRFILAISSDLRPALKVRALKGDYGCDLVNLMKVYMPTINYEYANERPFIKSLSSCRLYVNDYWATTYTESLSMNVPTILFWNPEFMPMLPEDQVYFDALRKVGILHDTPEAAAEAIHRVYDNVELWWQGAELQRVRQWFCDRYAHTSATSAKEWLTEFKRLGQL